ncbi:MAG: hypothetical protein IPN39_08100 [Chitinophagaceae bacterium]|nr:hypothetical protein [Chitinophagaceae bacterium]MBL0307376.1 hypothetical protein [Chitinophagaceae bacterium]HQV61022.1 hypothetical protein [Chitinophagaceae bacterium]HQV86367.1 hypothetical protein [Chitinophagaceae bacterium]HQX74306.1 hypothetical protein [Chitinophagaceae bacterium]
MKFTDNETLNNTLTFNACQADSLIEFLFNLPADFDNLTEDDLKYKELEQLKLPQT